MRRLDVPHLLGLLAIGILAGCWPMGTTAPARTPDPPAGNVRLWQDAAIFQPVRVLMSTAQVRLWVEMYEFERQDLADAMSEARARGADVRLVYDPSVAGSRTIAGRLRARGIECRPYPLDDRRHQIDHVKLLLNEGAALVGGMNWGRHSWANHDYAVQTELRPVLDALVAIFQHDWELAGGKALGLASPGPAGTAELGVVQTAPGEGVRDALVAALRNSSSRVLAEVFVLTDARILADLVAAARRGVIVQVLLDPNQEVNKTGHRLLRQAGVGVRWYQVPPGSKLHSKAGLFDGRLIVGSANWSLSGLSVNHELDLVLTDDAAAALFARRFAADWAAAAV
jgi:phosphatidylserine/phosphatidylglycerophosphate/cardiolipin synthase-like enzyme